MKTTNTIKISIIVMSMMAAIFSNANDFNLPDLGTPSDSSLSPIKEKEIRDEIVNQIYDYNLVMSDAIIADYIEQLGFRLAANSEDPQAPFDFFVVNENVVNASTYPGGLIIIFSGLILKSETESELAGVMAHEIAHATQRHMSRFYAENKKNFIPTSLGMVGAALAAQHSDSADAPVAVMAATQAMAQQAQINFTRAHEYEADRVGINTLIKTNYDPLGMAGFFEKLMREKPTDTRYHLPEYLRTHPLSINRVSEAKNRAQESVSSGKVASDYYQSSLYSFVKERIRILTKNVEIDSTNYYKKLFHESNKDEVTQAQKYGYALTLYMAHKNEAALQIVNSIKTDNHSKLIVSVLKAHIVSELNWKNGQALFEDLRQFYPENPIVIEAYIKALSANKNYKSTKKARQLARNLVLLYPENADYYQLLAIANQNMGMSIEANEALATKQHIINNNYKAVRILKNTLKSNLDYYQRARIESKITEYEALITDRERNRERQEDKRGRLIH